MSDDGFSSPRPYPPCAITAQRWFRRGNRDVKCVVAFAKRKRTSASTASVYAATTSRPPAPAAWRAATSARTRPRYSRATAPASPTSPLGSRSVVAAVSGAYAGGRASVIAGHDSGRPPTPPPGTRSERSRPSRVGEEARDPGLDALGDRLPVVRRRQPSSLAGMGQERRLDEHARHVGADQHVERTALHAQVGHVRIARREPADEPVLHGGRERDRLVHLPDLHEVAQDVAQ